jgi:class 3 adenylate cyclase
VKELEVTLLGPDAAELGIHSGLHSGSVTARVLRGERSRFQLLGDTVHMAARMESTGFCNKIQVSHATANQLIAAGKDHWLTKRNGSQATQGHK